MAKKKRKLTEDEQTALVMDAVLTLCEQGKMTRAQGHAVLDMHLKERKAREKKRSKR